MKIRIVSRLQAICFLIVVLACSPGEDPLPDPPLSDCKLSEVRGAEYITTYIYDNNGRIVQAKHQYKNELTVESLIEYNDNGHLIQITNPLQKSVFEYQESVTKPAKEMTYIRVSTSDAFEVDDTITYSYDATGRLITKTYRWGFVERYEYGPDNLARIFHQNFNQDEFLAQEFLEYDDRLNGLKGIPFRLFAIFDSQGIKEMLTRYNLTLSENQNNLIRFESINQSLTYTYEYNELGFPISFRYTDQKTPGNVRQASLEYNCH